MRPYSGCLGVILAFALTGCGAGSLVDGRDGAAANPVDWQTSTVTLTASDFWIVADGHRYDGALRIGDTHSDPGSASYTTLELTWSENDREMRLYIYLSADASGWWSNEMRTYNGQPPYLDSQTPSADWLYYRGTFFRSPSGTAFRGDLDLTNEALDPFRGELHLHGLVLSTTLTGS